MNDVNKLIDSAKMRILTTSENVFIRSVLFKLNWKIVEESQYAEMPTACTNGIDLHLNPNFVEHVGDVNKLVGLLLHEAWHVALKHVLPSRFEGKDPTIWNVAGDYVINNTLDSENQPIPDGGLIDHKFDGMSTDEVYNYIKKNKKDFQKQLDNSEVQSHIKPIEEEKEGSAGGAQSSSSIEGMTEEDVEQHINRMVSSSAIEAAVEGYSLKSAPKELQKIVYDLQNPQVNWKKALRRYVNSIKRNDFSNRKFNRKYLPEFYLPTLYSEEVGTVAMALDISGSITKKDRDNFITEVMNILKTIKPTKIVVYLFNTRIVKVIEVKNKQDVDNIVVRSGGGTDVNPVLQHITDNKINPKVLLIFSDMWIPEVKDKIPFPTIWVAFDNPRFKSSQGTTIYYDSSQ